MSALPTIAPSANAPASARLLRRSHPDPDQEREVGQGSEASHELVAPSRASSSRAPVTPYVATQ